MKFNRKRNKEQHTGLQETHRICDSEALFSSHFLTPSSGPFSVRAYFLFYLQNYLLRDQVLPIGNKSYWFICLFI